MNICVLCIQKKEEKKTLVKTFNNNNNDTLCSHIMNKISNGKKLISKILTQFNLVRSNHLHWIIKKCEIWLRCIYRDKRIINKHTREKELYSIYNVQTYTPKSKGYSVDFLRKHNYSTLSDRIKRNLYSKTNTNGNVNKN